MPEHRLFVSTETLDQWLVAERVTVEGDVLTLQEPSQRFTLKTAVHFLEEVAGGGDDAELIGKVKDVEVLTEMGGEHVSDSVILNDSAYQVVEGFLGVPIPGDEAEDAPPASGSDLASAARAAAEGETAEGADGVERLAQFFLGKQ